MGLAFCGGAQGRWDSRASLVSAPCLSSCGSLAVEHWLSSSSPREIFPHQESNTCPLLASPVLSPAAAAAKLLQSCPTLCSPIAGSPPGSPVPGILQARTLEWVAISFSNAWKGKVKVKSLSCVRLFATPWTAAHQAPLSMGLSRQEHWSGVPSPSPI